MDNLISDTADIAESVKFLGSCNIGDLVKIHEGVIIGFRNPYQDVFDDGSSRVVQIGPSSEIYPWVLIYEGAVIGSETRIHERCMIGSSTSIGDRSRIQYGAQIHDKVAISDDCIICGFVADNSCIGRGSSVFGSLVHRYDSPGLKNWDITDEPGPQIGEEAVIGWGAVIVGPVKIGNRAWIAPNAVVKEDIPAGERYGV